MYFILTVNLLISLSEIYIICFVIYPIISYVWQHLLQPSPLFLISVYCLGIVILLYVLVIAINEKNRSQRYLCWITSAAKIYFMRCLKRHTLSGKIFLFKSMLAAKRIDDDVIVVSSVHDFIEFLSTSGNINSCAIL